MSYNASTTSASHSLTHSICASGDERWPSCPRVGGRVVHFHCGCCCHMPRHATNRIHLHTWWQTHRYICGIGTASHRQQSGVTRHSSLITTTPAPTAQGTTRGDMQSPSLCPKKCRSHKPITADNSPSRPQSLRTDHSVALAQTPDSSSRS